MEMSIRVTGGKKAAETRVKLAEVRSNAYKFIRENPDVTPIEVAKLFDIEYKHAKNWITHCHQGKKDLFTKVLLGEQKQEIIKGGITELTFNQASEAIIYAFEQARLVPLLEEQIYRLENQLAATKNEYERLKKYYDDKEDQSRRFRLAQQHGDIGKID